MPGNEVLISIAASNTASPELAKAQQSIRDVSTAVQQSTKVHAEHSVAVDASTDTLRHFAVASRVAATDVAMTLNPALGMMVAQMGSVTRAGGTLGLTLALMAAGVVGVGAALGQIIKVSEQAAAKQAELNVAVRSLDVSAPLAQLKDFNLQYQVLYELSTGGWLGRLGVGWRTFTDAIGLTTDAMKGLVRAQEALIALAPFERRVGMAAARSQHERAAMTYQAVLMGQAESFHARPEFEERARYVQMDLLDRQNADRDRADAELQKLLQELVMNKAPQEYVAQAMEVGQAQRRALRLTQQAEATALGESIRRSRVGLIEYAFAPSGPEDPEAAAYGRPDASVLRASERAAEERRLAIDQARVKVLSEQRDLTDAQRLSFDLYAIAVERDLKVKQAGADIDKQELAIFEARMRSTERQRVEGEQQDPLLGLAAGFRDAAIAASRTGTIMQDFAKQTAGNMQRAFSDQFFTVLTGDFKKLPELGKTFGLAMVRSLTDALATMTTAPILRLLSGGSSSFFSFAGAGAAFGSGEGGGAIVEIGGQLFQRVAAGGGQTVLVPVGGGGGGGSMFSSMPGSGMVSSFGTWLSQPIGSLFGLTPEISELVTSETTIAAAGGPSAFTGLMGMSVGQAAAGAGAALALAFTVYQGLKGQPGGPTGASIASGAISGAMSGAILGTAIGGWAFGLGTVIGAVAGGLAGAGAAAMGKDTTPRSVAETARATGAAQNMIDQINQQTSPEELYACLTSWNSGTVGGTHGVAIVTQVPGATGVGPGTGAASAPFIGLPNSTYRVATLAEMMRLPVRASVQAGVDPSGLAQANQAVEQAIAAKKAQFAQFAGIEVSQTTTLGAGLSRTTTVPGSLAASLPGGVSINAAQLAALTDDERVAFLQQLRRVDAERSLHILVTDPDTLQTVSVTSV